MNKAAIWHEATQRYCFCLEPGRFRFRLQTGADRLRAVYLHTRDKYLPLTLRDTRKKLQMEKISSSPPGSPPPRPCRTKFGIRPPSAARRT